MRKFLFLFVLALGAILASCNSDPDSYENLLADEKESISKFIKRNNINVISSLPDDWGTVGENDYYLDGNGLYIHIVDTGAVGDTVNVAAYQLVLARYNKITLDSEPDTIIRYWDPIDAPYPLEFLYAVSDETIDAFQLATKYMKKSNSVAKLIVPSKLGTEEDVNAVIAYYYDFKISFTD